ncbi:50S ribosomal protein L29 [Candidatus Kaiserbacteria bacterium]|nr:50S ribosomal protein L29 [Candidatus Kaiserbacteria bacterium]
MKPADVRKKSTEELTKLIHELEGELKDFRFGMSGGRTKDVRKARTIRHDIARVKTILGARSKE